ncbi:hypothetical protein AAFF_G00193490 [Aldrovandia affinis]|uniref:Uncharacterized protein n=1 Tax=Aldrovandia affinis TaxID=143900 RepID=A0AAD7WVE9_9TELE|nr:hypothetical protein AAFF_G00193490 [Aldrovandia affinis]
MLGVQETRVGVREGSSTQQLPGIMPTMPPPAPWSIGGCRTPVPVLSCAGCEKRTRDILKQRDSSFSEGAPHL